MSAAFLHFTSYRYIMASSTGTLHSVIEKLNENNYAEWKNNLYDKKADFCAKRKRAAGVSPEHQNAKD
ncbi:hypothetical protein CROQUDRAFT_96318 [Cronartium quercuum f. sp. fusiforme G11]|uniref:Uncharacterized protein n=1 Tax=Cronartium quercuum f. sp. fusiforme G11 TaxID=708437 RepID=A0A9P6NBB6_9BASI|nr:hypothetical protein CROQUDRAFT_96318 [Cronartium quercuum f. sp. fusiforme G11]